MTTDYKECLLSRTPAGEIHIQIILDLTESEALLSADYLDGYLEKYSGNPERVRPTRSAAAALLARAYLYTHDYANADKSSQVINQSSLYQLSGLDEVFLKNSTEAIWQLQPVNEGKNTEDALTFIIPEVRIKR